MSISAQYTWLLLCVSTTNAAFSFVQYIYNMLLFRILTGILLLFLILTRTAGYSRLGAALKVMSKEPLLIIPLDQARPICSWSASSVPSSFFV